MSARGNSLLSARRIVPKFHHQHLVKCSFYYTNADRVRREDPYQILGLQWGDGATLAEIKAAYRAKAAKLHPDVNPDRDAAERFQKLQLAYELLTKAHTYNAGQGVDEGGADAWRVSLWRNGDRIAVNRKDVAGKCRLRPIPPVSVDVASYSLGNSANMNFVNSDYIGMTDKYSLKSSSSSSVGSGRSKWVTPQSYKPWKRG